VRIAFATTGPEVVHGADQDRPLHEEAFARGGVELAYCAWWDGEVEWDRYDLVVIRSTWDYVPRLTEYRRWLRAIDRLGTLRNPAPLVEWNIDKRYLSALGAVGVPVIPTRIANSEEELASALAEPGEHVVKPVVSAGSADTGRFAPGDPAAMALGRGVLSRGVPVMVQPAVQSVATEGEISAVLMGGTVSHSFRRGPVLALGGGEHNRNHEEDVAAEELSADQERVVGLAMEAVGRIAVDLLGVGTPLLYARIDLVRADDGGNLVLEVELNEPSFFLPMDDRAADRFVAATMAQLGS
jgi:glutathione synthase/RimK-type ligase-like ATP-grasp enzyme